MSTSTESGSKIMGDPTPSTPHLTSSICPMHILGCGSIGLLYASAIQSAYNCLRDNDSNSHHNIASRKEDVAHPVTLLMRAHHKPYLKLRFDTNVQAPHWFAPVSVCRTSEDSVNCTILRKCDIPVQLIDDEANENKYGTQHQKIPIKCLLLCTKANDAIPALNSVWDRLISSPISSSPAQVIVLSNGALAIRDAIYKHFGSHGARTTNQVLDGGVHIVLGTTTHGAYKTQPSQSANIGHYTITHAGDGTTHCTNGEFVQICKSSGWDSTSLSELDMHAMLWKKLAVNCVINPLTAIHGVKNGQLLELNHMGQDINVTTMQILEEVSHVAIMEMESLRKEDRSNKGGYGSKHDTWLRSTREQLSVASLQQFVFKVMSDTKNNVSSMLQDVKARRTTEIRFLNGYVASLSKEKYGLECPRNMEMCRLVEDLQP